MPKEDHHFLDVDELCYFQEELRDMGDVRQLVNKLYAALNIDQHQVEKEREILAHIEDVKTKLAPLEKVSVRFSHLYLHELSFNI